MVVISGAPKPTRQIKLSGIFYFYVCYNLSEVFWCWGFDDLPQISEVSKVFTLYGRLSHWKIPNIILKYQQKDDTTLQKHIPKFSHKKTQQPEREKKLSANSKNCANFFMLLWSKPGASWRRPQWHGQSWKRPWIRPMDGGKNSVRFFFGLFWRWKRRLFLH